MLRSCVILLAFAVVVGGTSKSQLKLHNFMDDEELKFYFGSETDLPEYEIIDLPESLLDGRESVIDGSASEEEENKKFVNFKVFGKQVTLTLHPNKHLMSPYAKIITRTSNSTTRIINESRPYQSCHFLHVDSFSTAAISNCDPKEIYGLVFLPSDTFEILPLSQRLSYVLNRRESFVEATNGGVRVKKAPHLVKRALFSEGSFENDFLLLSFNGKSTSKVRGMNFDHPNIELGLFFDEAFYKFFSPFFKRDSEKLRNFILSYINGVQSLFYHSSLGRKVDITIVHLEIMEEQPSDMPHAYGERNALIDNFCEYQRILNPGDDRHPEHWDMAAYISGLDFFAWDSKGSKNGATMGLATVGGVCNDNFNCIIAEFGSINQFGKPYPSSGFTAVYILAHEIGHNLGMAHDSTGNSCTKEGFVMSPTRGTQGETNWSPCSASIVQKLDWAKCLFDSPSAAAKDLDPWKFNGYPGISYTAKDQCEILLRDEDATIFVNGVKSTICDNLHCRTPKRPGFFFAGPALQGTECGDGKWCEGGTCVNRKDLIQTTTEKPRKPTWGPWKETQCVSECLRYGKGYQKKRRFCNHPSASCDGPSVTYALCDDAKICESRKSVMDHATQKCKEFSHKLASVDGDGVGLQASYESLRLWMPCAIFCKRKNTTSYFTPRVELNGMGMNPYFPDGTLCHRDENEKYYCIQNHCLPESTMLSKAGKSLI